METNVIEVEWEYVIQRLKHHRTRLSISKAETKAYIKQKYGKTFHALSDDQIIELGTTLGNCRDKFTILSKEVSI
jgi:hypothetical protein